MRNLISKLSLLIAIISLGGVLLLMLIGIFTADTVMDLGTKHMQLDALVALKTMFIGIFFLIIYAATEE